MNIVINNTKFLFLYRLSIFKLFTFKTNNKELKNIVNALNIKKRKERIKYVYDEAIKIINIYYSDDLCKFKDNKCIAQRKNNSKTISGCCRTCPILTDKGCPSVNITCKLLYCKTALQNLKALKISNISILKCLSLSQRLILKTDFYATKEQIINDLYYGIFSYCFRSTFREIKNKLKSI